MAMSSDDYFHLKEVILSKRKQMVGLRSKDHWLTLPPEVREVLSKAFGRLTFVQIADISGFPKGAVEEWTTQHQMAEDLHRRIKSCRSLPGGRIATELRPEICSLASIVSSRAIEREFGIARTTVRNWVKQGWDKVDLSDDPGLLDKPLPRRYPYRQSPVR